MNRNQLRSSAIATGAASLLLLTGAPAAQAGAWPDPDDHDQAEAAIRCDGMIGKDAVDEWGDELQDFTPEDRDHALSPDLDQADTSGYKPCDGLSAITVPYPDAAGGATTYSITMLFYDGEYLGTDTAEPREWVANVVPITNDTLLIEYPHGHDDHAVGPEGIVQSTFTWNEDTQSVDHEGEFPPAG